MEVISWAKPPSDEDARAARQADAWLTPVWPFRPGTVSKKWPPEAPEKAEKSRPRAPKIPTQSTQNRDPGTQGAKIPTERARPRPRAPGTGSRRRPTASLGA